MILWRLRGVTPKELTCSIEKRQDGSYRFLVERGGEVERDEDHASVESARAKAELLKRTLAAQGWTESPGV